jgi:hypothetical protein
MNQPYQGFPPPGFPAPQQGFAPAPQPGFPAPAPQYPQPQYAPQGYAPAPVQPVTGLGLGNMLQTADESADRQPPLPQGGHKLFEVERVFLKRSTNPQNQGVIFFIANCVILESALCAPGTKFDFVETIVGAKFDQADAVARVRGFVAAVQGIDPNSPQARTDITENMIRAVCHDSNPLRGKRAAVASCVHKLTKPKIGRNGQQIPAGVIQKLTFALSGASVASAPVQAPVAPAPAVQPQVSFPPTGWASAEPTYPGHYHNGKECIPEAALRALMAAGRA